MRSLISVLVVCGLSLGMYYYFLKQAAPEPGTIATQAISTTGVEMDLNAIAQSERMYFTQNGSYAPLDTLISSGTMNLAGNGRDGYTYSVETSPAGFTATARHADIPPDPATHSLAIHYPTVSVDQTMQIHQSN